MNYRLRLVRGRTEKELAVELAADMARRLAVDQRVKTAVPAEA